MMYQSKVLEYSNSLIRANGCLLIILPYNNFNNSIFDLVHATGWRQSDSIIFVKNFISLSRHILETLSFRDDNLMPIKAKK